MMGIAAAVKGIIISGLNKSLGATVIAFLIEAVSIAVLANKYSTVALSNLSFSIFSYKYKDVNYSKQLSEENKLSEKMLQRIIPSNSLLIDNK